MKKNKTKTLQIRRIISIFIVIFILLALRNFVYQIWKKGQSKQTRLLWNNELIQMSDNIYVENSVIYFSKEDIQNILDDTIYYNIGDKELITTYNKHVGVLHLQKNEMLVNDSVLPIQGTLKEIDSKIYLPVSELGIVYDVEVEYAESTNLVIMNSTTQKKLHAIALDDTKIKQSNLPFSIPIEKVSRGDDLYILEDAKGWKKVRTNVGNIGYIKNKFISEEEVLREDWVEEKNEDIDFKNMSNFLVVTKEKINITSIANTFATYSQRSNIIKSLYDETIKDDKYLGICIDFEQIDDMNSFNRFLIELTPKFRESGLKVIVKLNEQINQEKVKKIVDFTI